MPDRLYVPRVGNLNQVGMRGKSPIAGSFPYNKVPNRSRTGRKGKSVKSIERGLINLAGLVIFLGSLAFVGMLLARWAI